MTSFSDSLTNPFHSQYIGFVQKTRPTHEPENQTKQSMVESEIRFGFQDFLIHFFSRDVPVQTPRRTLFPPREVKCSCKAFMSPDMKPIAYTSEGHYRRHSFIAAHSTLADTQSSS